MKLKNIELMDLAIYLPKKNILVIADTHIGFEEALNKQGILLPRMQFKDTLERIDSVIKRLQEGYKIDKFEKVIINGDIKHEFGTISETEWRHTLRLLDFLLKYCKEIVLIKGNHDTILDPIAKKRNVTIVDEYQVDDILFLHGDKIPKSIPDVKTIVIGHEHPAVRLDEGTRTETFKCFLVGKYKDKHLIVQPSFNLVTEGTNVLMDKLLSPFLKDISKFKVLVVGDKIYDFGMVKELAKHS